MELTKEKVEKELDEFSSYIESGDDDRKLLRPVLQETRDFIMSVFGRAKILENAGIEKICTYLDVMVVKLLEDWEMPDVIAHLHETRAKLLRQINKGEEKRDGKTPAKPQARALSHGPIPAELEEEFEKYPDGFCLELITKAWCAWILDQLGVVSFEEVSTGSQQRICIYPWYFVQWAAFLANVVRKSNRGRRKDDIELKISDARRVLELVHGGSSFTEALEAVEEEIRDRESALKAGAQVVDIPPELAEEFEKYPDGFCLELISQRWCKWILDQLGVDSFKEVNTVSQKRILIYPSQFLQFGAFLSSLVYQSNRERRKQDVKLARTDIRRVMELVGEGSSFAEALAAVESELRAEAQMIDIPPELEEELKKYPDGFCFEIVTQRWCAWILEQLGVASFEEVRAHSGQKIDIYPSYRIQLVAFLVRFARQINRGRQTEVANLKQLDALRVLQLVHEGSSFTGALYTVEEEIRGREALLKAETEGLDIPPELAVEFKKYPDGFCFEIVTQRWCLWILGQLGVGSFEEVSTGSQQRICIYPSHFVKFRDFFKNVANQINRGRRKEDMQLKLSDARRVLQLVHEGSSFAEALATVEEEIRDRGSALKAEAQGVAIPWELAEEFKKYPDGFCLEIVTQRWCAWMLAQLGVGSFEEVSTGSQQRICIYPSIFLQFKAFLNSLVYQINRGRSAEDEKLARTDARRVLHLVHQGQTFADAVATVVAEVEEAQKTREDREQAAARAEAERKRLEEELEALLEDVADDDTQNPDAQSIRNLIEAFGAAASIDILYLKHPQYAGLPRRRVQGIVGEIGSYLRRMKPKLPDVVSDDWPDMLTPTLEDLLFITVKECVLGYCNDERRAGSTQHELDIVLAFLTGKEAIFNSRPYFTRTRERILQYYCRIFDEGEFKKPTHMVDSLAQGRGFPDLNQRVNVIEIADHHNMLIADDMGLGKSASAIFTKEFLRLKRALVVAPPHVIETWCGYLSDTVALDGQHVGYFRPGQAQRVLVIRCEADLKQDFAQYDYVLVSSARLQNNGYFDALMAGEFDYIVADEIHKFKNLLKGKRSKKLVALCGSVQARNGYVALLSGTPVPNKIADLATIFRILYPDKFADLTDMQLALKIASDDILELKADLRLRMQMKELAATIDLPQHTEEEVWLDFAPWEETVYEALLEDDELTPMDKISRLRRFCIDPRSIDCAPVYPSTKTTRLNADLNGLLAEGNKSIVFVNGFKRGILRSDNGSGHTLLQALELPDGVRTYIIDGSTLFDERTSIQRELNEGTGPMVLFVNGQTADVGVSYVGAHDIRSLNDPWTIFEKEQQIARVRRPGLKHPTASTAYRMRASFEAAFYEYTERKYVAIMDLL